jgi:hypothetical protein
MAADKMKIMNFASAPELRAWLAKNHSRSEGILLRLRNAQQDQPLFHRLPLADRERYLRTDKFYKYPPVARNRF